MAIQSLFLTATDTGVGKTYFSVKIIQNLIDSGAYKKEEIAYYKPIQCGEEKSETGLRTDFSYVHEATGVDVYNSYFFKHPCSPHYAAELEGVTINLDKILEDFNSLKKQYKFILVEGAGGIAVPLNNCELISDLAVKLELPLVIVTRPDLGTINHSLITLGHAKKKNLEILGLLIAEPSHTGEEYSISDAEFLEKQRENSIKTICEMMNVLSLQVNEVSAAIQAKGLEV